MFQHTAARRRLVFLKHLILTQSMFQHTAARRRLVSVWDVDRLGAVVSTHSRPKAAGIDSLDDVFEKNVSTHSRPKAAGSVPKGICGKRAGFNTQPPEGGWGQRLLQIPQTVSFNTQPPEGGWPIPLPKQWDTVRFQHTAARRRLVNIN